MLDSLKFLALLATLLLASRALYAQPSSPHPLEPDLLLDKPTLWLSDQPDSLHGHWRWGVDVTTFLRDAEFSLPYTRGYTAVGFFASPFVQHRIKQHAQATFGVHLSGAAGYQGLYSCQPLVRLEYEPLPHLRLVMGSIYGTLSHNLYEPMLDRERFIYAHQEEGVQVLAHTPHWTTDTWLHWENLLEPWQMDQERFTLGSSNTITPLNFQLSILNSQLSLSIPLSFLGSHRGGQFSALDTCIESLLTESIGLTLNSQFSILNSQLSLSLHTPWFFYQDISPTSWQTYDRGHGFWPQLTYDYRNTHNLHLMGGIGFWMGHQFIAPRGSYLFQSVSWHRPSFSEPDRRMVTARLALEHDYSPDFHLGADVEVYHNLTEKGTDIAFGLYLRYNPKWSL